MLIAFGRLRPLDVRSCRRFGFQVLGDLAMHHLRAFHQSFDLEPDRIELFLDWIELFDQQLQSLVERLDLGLIP